MSLFVDPDPELEELKEDLAWPFALNTAGDLATVRGKENLESALVARGCTPLGDLPHRERYGLDLEDCTGGPSVVEEHAIIEARLLEQYLREPRVENVTVTVVQDPAEPSDTVARVHGYARTGVPVDTDIGFTSGGK